MPDSLFAVILKSEPAKVVPALAEALAKFEGVPYQDTIRVAKHAWGIVKEKMAEADAARLVAALAEKSIAATVAPMSALATVPEARVGDRIEINADGFRIHLSAGETPWLPWNSVWLIAAGAIKETITRITKEKQGPSQAEKAAKLAITLATGIPLPTTKEQEIEVRKETTEIIAVMDIFLEKPAARLRLNAARLGAFYLAERRLLDSFGNFRLVLTDLATRAPNARRNMGVGIFLSGGALNTMGYESLADLDREERWLLTTAALK